MNTNADLISIFNKLNMKQTLCIKDMVDLEEYNITGAERVTTKYGEVIVLELGTNLLYLPKRFNSLTDKDVESFSSGLYLISKIPMNDEKNGIFYRLELKMVPNTREYYPFNNFSTFK